MLEIWNATVDGCQFRKLILDQLYHDLDKYREDYKTNWAADSLDGNIAELMKNEALVFALIRRLSERNRARPPNPSELKGCVYHVHEDGDMCPVK